MLPHRSSRVHWSPTPFFFWRRGVLIVSGGHVMRVRQPLGLPLGLPLLAGHTVPDGVSLMLRAAPTAPPSAPLPAMLLLRNPIFRITATLRARRRRHLADEGGTDEGGNEVFSSRNFLTMARPLRNTAHTLRPPECRRDVYFGRSCSPLGLGGVI